MAPMPYALNSPAIQIASYQLRITCDQIEWQIDLGRVELCNKVQQAFSYAYTLIIR